MVLISALRVVRIATWARTVAAYAAVTTAGWLSCSVRNAVTILPALAATPRRPVALGTAVISASDNAAAACGGGAAASSASVAGGGAPPEGGGAGGKKFRRGGGRRRGGGGGGRAPRRVVGG